MAGRGPRRRRVDASGIPLAVAPTGVAAGDLEKPRHIASDPQASQTWDHVCGILASRGDLRPGYALAIGMLASEHARYIAAAEIARREPVVVDARGVRQNPAATTAGTAGRAVAGLLHDLGLTARALATIDAPSSSPVAAVVTSLDIVSPTDPDVDELERFYLEGGSRAEADRTVAEILERRRRRR